MHSLGALHLKTTFIILDVTRAGSLVLPSRAGGLTWVEPETNMLIAFNAAPDTVARDVGDGYGPDTQDKNPESAYPSVRGRLVDPVRV